MSDTLFGKEVSGTPLETRGLTTEVASEFSGLISDPSQGMQRIADTFGINLGELGLQDFASGIFDGTGASSSFAAFDEANRPFQQRAVTEQAGRTASAFGTGGGRFSMNLLGAQNAGATQLEQGFDQNRLQFGQAQRGQDIQALLGTLGALPGLSAGSLAGLNSAAGFARPGAPIFQQGIAGELLGAAGALGGAAIGNPAGAGQVVSGVGNFFKGLFGAGGGGSRSGRTSNQNFGPKFRL